MINEQERHILIQLSMAVTTVVAQKLHLFKIMEEIHISPFYVYNHTSQVSHQLKLATLNSYTSVACCNKQNCNLRVSIIEVGADLFRTVNDLWYLLQYSMVHAHLNLSVTCCISCSNNVR